jgi:hypothetical protein
VRKRRYVVLTLADISAHAVFAALRAFALWNHSYTALFVVLGLGLIPAGLQLVSVLLFFCFYQLIDMHKVPHSPLFGVVGIFCPSVVCM